MPRRGLVKLPRRFQGGSGPGTIGVTPLAALPPNRSLRPSRWPRLRAFFGKAFARPAASTSHGRVIHEYFRHKAHDQGYTLSHSQQRVIDYMAQQANALLQPDARPHASRSLYLHGAVGRGKSWLLDGFFRAIPLAEKQRLHFHDFFAQLHQGMFRHREQPDALEATLDELLSHCRVLCFDEFHVHDIGDAMLITRLFKALFQRGILLLVTSNYAPQGLLPNPLYHARFKPVIDLIASRMQVMEVGGPHDYRSQPRSHSQQVFTQGRYLWPGSEQQRLSLGLPRRNGPTSALMVGARQLQVRLCEQHSVGFAFSDLCEQPTAVMDYLELSRRFDHWIIDELPELGECPIAVQQRFINLIDVLYDQDKHLTLIGERSLRESLGGNAIDLARTRSRLGQLQEISADTSPS
ncbi:AFG1-like ATPase [Pseudomonas chlororaphis subsp. piscium]|nr:AFG1-like ATPase [Pseudomonas chlororaphis subsp. piscium]AZC58247.1 AFG1-like ATPase [Pseudomonas chlororaphis subsp. piscium]AZC64452.1 AFG1-like ATPase [Pseudomonas chlororaphis subsp. piscium]AZC70704.1 AFG1-like ATPase [Pseudomonas chlororaphis subsp. piscium]AZC76935.1 AFG1-like ATPase [Pseudomonas chlororaphis subsp. piscium]